MSIRDPQGPRPPPTLFEDVDGRRDRLNAALDSARDKFGDRAITRARLLERPRDEDGVDYLDPRKR